MMGKKKWMDIMPARECRVISGDADIVVTGITFDSRRVEQGFVFVAQKGSHADGHLYIEQAISKGASVIVCETIPENLHERLLYIQANDSGKVLGLLASAWYDNPSEKLKVIGVTGTNGKTSIATLSYNLFTMMGYRVGLISTISVIIGYTSETATHTTPDALTIQALMAKMVDDGCDYCFMEVSSHAVVQQRIAGIVFTGGVFTNLTHDHLDYHKTFADYLKAKKGFFDQLPEKAFAIINLDDKNGRVMVQNCKAKVVTYSTWTMANFRCKVLESHFDGMLLSFNGQEVWTHFVGKFNASNLLAVYAIALELQQSQLEVLRTISQLTPVKGRFETIRSSDGKMAIVDYAHTPDALKNVLSAIAEIRSGNEQVITVVGAGGDRDRTKRPEMAKEAIAASDRVILTSDNPRTEDPEAIIREMEAGIDSFSRNKVVSITNRREAIKTALHIARPGDIILVAGKGHENYQEINGVKYHFDDREIIEEMFYCD